MYPVCRPIQPAQWFCTAPRAGCPANTPQAGTVCNMPGLDCSRDCDLVVRCSGGVWEWIQGACPICASPDTPIATPDGDRPIASLRVGDLVYSVDHEAIVAVPLVLVGRTPVAAHHVMRVVLADGAVLEMSPGHPTADGRPFGELAAGSALDDDHIVVSADLVPYKHDATYDVLPASSTGIYFAAGARVASTLRSDRSLR
jgi:Hint domain-containing protein